MLAVLPSRRSSMVKAVAVEVEAIRTQVEKQFWTMVLV